MLVEFRFAFPTANYNASPEAKHAMGLFAYAPIDGVTTALAYSLFEKPIDNGNLNEAERAEREPDESFAETQAALAHGTKGKRDRG